MRTQRRRRSMPGLEWTIGVRDDGWPIVSETT